MLFTNPEHRDFYDENVKSTRSETDIYRKALFYTLGIVSDCREHVRDLYDYADNGIDPEGLCAAWQTGTSTKITRLAFNLYNGYTGDNDEDPASYTPYELCDLGPLTKYAIYAIAFRFGNAQAFVVRED